MNAPTHEPGTVTLPQLMDQRGLARYLGITPRSVYNLQREGMPIVRITPRMPRYPVADVLRWLEERNTGGGAE